MAPHLEDALRQRGVPLRELPRKEGFALQRNWLARFAQGVKERKGHWTFRGYIWHGFSYGFQRCIVGADAMARYQAQPSEDFYVFDEDARHVYECSSPDYPDLTDYRDEAYVFPKSGNWTMVFTHEQSIGLGPYFASIDEQQAQNPSTA